MRYSVYDMTEGTIMETNDISVAYKEASFIENANHMVRMVDNKYAEIIVDTTQE